MTNPDAIERFVPNLDSMLTKEEAAEWLKMKPRDLAAKSLGRRPVIPVFRASRQTLRYHPRTIIAKMARDAGVPMDLIAASFGIRYDRSPENPQNSS